MKNKSKKSCYEGKKNLKWRNSENFNAQILENFVHLLEVGKQSSNRPDEFHFVFCMNHEGIHNSELYEGIHHSESSNIQGCKGAFKDAKFSWPYEDCLRVGQYPAVVHLVEQLFGFWSPEESLVVW